MVPSLAVLGGSPRRFPLFIVASIICVVVFVYLWRHTYEDSSSYFSIEGEVHPTFNLESQPRRHLRTHVAVASLFIFHFDVYLAAAHTIRDVLGDQGTVDVFAVDQPYPFGFQEVIDRLDLYSREVRDTKDLLDVLSATDFYPDEPGAMVDLLLLGTCEIEYVSDIYCSARFIFLTAWLRLKLENVVGPALEDMGRSTSGQEVQGRLRRA